MKRWWQRLWRRQPGTYIHSPDAFYFMQAISLWRCGLCGVIARCSMQHAYYLMNVEYSLRVFRAQWRESWVRTMQSQYAGRQEGQAASAAFASAQKCKKRTVRVATARGGPGTFYKRALCFSPSLSVAEILIYSMVYNGNNIQCRVSATTRVGFADVTQV